MGSLHYSSTVKTVYLKCIEQVDRLVPAAPATRCSVGAVISRIIDPISLSDFVQRQLRNAITLDAVLIVMKIKDNNKSR
jgi:hypothetical protein